MRRPSREEHPSYHIIYYHVISYHIISCSTTSHLTTIWHHMTSHHIIYYRIISHHLIWYDIIPWWALIMLQLLFTIWPSERFLHILTAVRWVLKGILHYQSDRYYGYVSSSFLRLNTVYCSFIRFVCRRPSSKGVHGPSSSVFRFSLRIADNTAATDVLLFDKVLCQNLKLNQQTSTFTST